MTTTTQAARLLLLWTSAQGDRARHAPDHDVRLHAQEMIDLLTPVAKAWSTDVGFAAASLGVQVLGGAGFIEESGMAQRLRDGRIAPIYEGTNGIQAIDLVTRKISREQGKWVHQLLDEISSVASTTTDAELTDSARALASAVDALRTSTQSMLEQLEHHPDDAIAGASAYLELFGVTMGGWLLTRRALGSTSAQRERFVGECNFFALDQLTKAPGLAQVATAGARHLTVPIGDRA